MAVATAFVAALSRSRCSFAPPQRGSLEEEQTLSKAARQGASPTRILRLFYVRDYSIQHGLQHAGERSIHEDAQEAAKAVLLLRPPPSLRLLFEAGAGVLPGGACKLGRRTRPGRQGQLLVPHRLSLKLRQQPPMLQAFMRAEKFCKLSWVPMRVHEAGRRLLGSHNGHYKLLQASGDLPERLSKRGWVRV